MKLNLHLGVPSVMPHLLSTVAEKCGPGSRRSAHFIAHETWKSTFRGVINSKPMDFELEPKVWKSALKEVSKLTQHAVVAASQPALLGAASDCYLRKTMLPYSERRLERLSDLFSGVDLVLHLTITSQLDHFGTVQKSFPEDGLPVRPTTLPSWSELVARIRVCLPDSEVIVWDFEQPNRTSLAFVLNVLNIADEALVTTARKTILQSFGSLGSDSRHAVGHGLPSEVADELDAQYEFDLQALTGMDGVTLVTWDKIPDKFYLDT